MPEERTRAVPFGWLLLGRLWGAGPRRRAHLQHRGDRLPAGRVRQRLGGRERVGPGQRRERLDEKDTIAVAHAVRAQAQTV